MIFLAIRGSRIAQDILLVIPADTRSLEDGLHELAALEWVKENTPELEGDGTARRELRRSGAIRRQLDEALAAILDPSEGRTPTSTWFHRGQKLRVASRRALQEHLSRLCAETYAHTPHLRNELINRRELSSAAAAARRNLIEAMVLHAAEPELGIAGTPPEKSIYLSLLAHPGIHRSSADGWHFGPPSRNAHEGIKAVWSAVTAYFGETEREAKPVLRLYERLSAPPFGVLAGPLPVLLCAALLANDNRVALYEEGSFVPQLTIAIFERLLRARTGSRYSNGGSQAYGPRSSIDWPNSLT